MDNNPQHPYIFRHILRDIFIWKMSWFGIAWVYRTLIARRQPLVRIVVFHDVPDEEWFASMIETLSETSHIMTPQEFYAHTCVSNAVNTLVTFDDGYASWQHIALPVLKRFDVHALFFVNSGLLDAAHGGASDAFMEERLHITPRAPLSWEGVRALHAAGHTIGGHARTHANLTTLTSHELRDELISDKHKLEEMVGAPVTDFAYPFGTHAHVNDAVAAAVGEVGYNRAYTAISRFDIGRDAFRIPRMCIESDMSPRALTRWLRGAYDLFDMMKQLCVR